jgi:uncharacterized membrane protein
MNFLLLFFAFIFSYTLSAQTQTRSSVQVNIQEASSDEGMIRILLFSGGK